MIYYPPKLPVVANFNSASKEEATKIASAISESLDTNGIGVSLMNTIVSPVNMTFHYDFNGTDWTRNNIRKIKTYKDTFEATIGHSLNIVTEPNQKGMFVVVPNLDRPTIPLGNLLLRPEYVNYPKNPTTVVIGLDTMNKPVILDIDKMPHLLVSGTTGSGKSVLMNTIITSILANAIPPSVNFVFIDPKRVEFTKYEKLEHFLRYPVAFESRKALGILWDLVQVMEDRQKMFQEVGAQNIDDYNAILQAKNQILPKIIVFVDELADLVMQNKKETESRLMRLAQKGRSAGIHLVCATQRPSADIISTSLRVNFPMRIGLKVPDAASSKIAINQTGCQDLIGKGDGLYYDVDSCSYKRFQSAYVSDKEVKDVIEQIEKQWK